MLRKFSYLLKGAGGKRAGLGALLWIAGQAKTPERGSGVARYALLTAMGGGAEGKGWISSDLFSPWHRSKPVSFGAAHLA